MIYEKFDTELSTFDTSSYDFIPEYLSHWRNDTVDLSFFSNENILIKFESTNRQGNNLYLDNIKVYQGLTAPLSTNKIEALEYIIYPNPATASINIILEETNNDHIKIKLFNTLGEQLLQTTFTGNNKVLSIANFSSGIYFIQLSNSRESSIKSFIKW